MNSETFQATQALFDELIAAAGDPERAAIVLNRYGCGSWSASRWELSVGVEDLIQFGLALIDAGEVKASSRPTRIDVLESSPTTTTVRAVFTPRHVDTDPLSGVAGRCNHAASGRTVCGCPVLRCRCGALLVGSVCAGDAHPPRCGKCQHALSHGRCPLCEPDAWTTETGAPP